jgi:hypothetical protein
MRRRDDVMLVRHGMIPDFGDRVVAMFGAVTHDSALLRNRVEVRRREWFPVRGRNHGIEPFELLGLRCWA